MPVTVVIMYILLLVNLSQNITQFKKVTHIGHTIGKRFSLNNLSQRSVDICTVLWSRIGLGNWVLHFFFQEFVSEH